MGDQVSGKLHADYQVDGLSVGFTKIEQAPGQRAAHDLGRRIPLEWQRHDFRVVSRLN